MKHTASFALQRGSVTNVVLLIICLGLLGKLAFAVIPEYVGNYQLTKLVKHELHEANTARATPKQFLADLDRQLQINANYNTKAEDIVHFTNQTPGSLGVKLQYETESQYYGSTYVVNRFETEISAADAAAK